LRIRKILCKVFGRIDSNDGYLQTIYKFAEREKILRKKFVRRKFVSRSKQAKYAVKMRIELPERVHERKSGVKRAPYKDFTSCITFCSGAICSGNHCEKIIRKLCA
jgi:hypothetical protein